MSSSSSLAKTSKPAILHLYKRLLRSAKNYPSVNREGIYNSIVEEFKMHKNLDPNDPDTVDKVNEAYQGLSQLNQFSPSTLSKAGEDSEWEIHCGGSK